MGVLGKLEEVERGRREKSKMVVDILLLLAGLVFSIDEPDVNNRYVEYSPGNTNLVFTVPHDGQTYLTSIPTRQNGCRDVVGGVCYYPSSEDCQKPFLCRAVLRSDVNTHAATLQSSMRLHGVASAATWQSADSCAFFYP